MLDKIECLCGLASLASNDIGCHLCVGMTPQNDNAEYLS